MFRTISVSLQSSILITNESITLLDTVIFGDWSVTSLPTQQLVAYIGVLPKKMVATRFSGKCFQLFW